MLLNKNERQIPHTDNENGKNNFKITIIMTMMIIFFYHFAILGDISIDPSISGFTNLANT